MIGLCDWLQTVIGRKAGFLVAMKIDLELQVPPCSSLITENKASMKVNAEAEWY